MTSGTISGNAASVGGGLYVSGGVFTMSGGIISNNTANKGGGVYAGAACFNQVDFAMRGGAISGNIATECGGGVFIWREGCGLVAGSVNFAKTNGAISGYKSDPTNGNVVKDEDGNVLARKGHAIYVGEDKRKETTAGPGANFSKDGSGPWDQ
jgi:hypothetical protein